MTESRHTLIAEGHSFSWRIAARNLLTAVGSLRLTVFLLALGLILILIATLQQTRHDVYQVKKQHFSSALVYVPFQEMVIPAWFPELQSVGGGFIMPSGVSVLIAMLVNLICAHLMRFRIQASGRRLGIGIGILGLGIILTLLVILNGNSPGFQETPLISWNTQWLLCHVGLGLAGIAALAGGMFLEGRVRQIFSALTGVVLLALLAYLLYRMFTDQSPVLDENGLRVLWRLFQGTVAAVVCFAGAVMLFRRKAGIVIVHSGLLMLMIGEMVTTWSAVEQRMFFFEHDTSQHTFNVDESELALITRVGDGQEKVIAIDSDALLTNEILDDPRLPVRIRMLEYFPNSTIGRADPNSAPYPGQRGLASVFGANGSPQVTGVDSDAINLASAYVELIPRDGKESLGVFLVSQQLFQNDQLDLDSFEVDGQQWQLALRFEHYYKPYQVELISTTREVYLGTDTPRTFASEFRIIDPQRGVDELKNVSMNRPLRYNNETFYQAGHGTAPDGRKWSILQVVLNTGWLIPYVSCAFVGLGLLMHFLSIFIRFAEKLAPTSSRYDALSWSLVTGSLLVFGLLAWWLMRPVQVEFESMNLTELGKLPVVEGGRVQPLDSVARTTLRTTSFRETALDAEGNKQPAIRWLADWIFDEPGADQYLIFKVDDLDIQSALELVRRKGFMYSHAEITSGRTELERMVAEARSVAERDKTALTPMQRRVRTLYSQYQTVNNLRLALSGPGSFATQDPTQALAIAQQVESATGMVKAVPGEAEDDWSVLSPLKSRYWLADMARDNGLTTPRQLAEFMMDGEATNRLEDRLFEEELMIDVARQLRMDMRNLDMDKLQQLVEQLLQDPDPETRDALQRRREQVQPNIDAQIVIRRPQLVDRIAAEIIRVMPLDNDGNFDEAALADPPPLVQLESLWRARQAGEFNAAVQEHAALASQSPGTSGFLGRVAAEFFQNQAAPFFVARALYISALLLTLLSWGFMAGAHNIEWLGRWADGTRRASFWLMILAFAIHTIGLVLRIYISGRPPVTNLYSSAIFIGWAAAILGMVVERFAGHSFGTLLSSVAGWLTIAVAIDLAVDGDTFVVLQAVLDTQFWLSTHVVTITLGYAATFVAGSLGALYLLICVFAPENMNKTRDMLTRLIYGVTCFALLCSFTGTVLGGLWADDSWGRFWGWDPKENGALMIVLANALLLHARWAGLVRQRGIALLAVFGSIVTIWSWFAVNELGVGLHAYGVSEDRMSKVVFAWLIHSGILLLGLIPERLWLSNWLPRSSPAEDGGTAK